MPVVIGAELVVDAVVVPVDGDSLCDAFDVMLLEDGPVVSRDRELVMSFELLGEF